MTNFFSKSIQASYSETLRQIYDEAFIDMPLADLTDTALAALLRLQHRLIQHASMLWYLGVITEDECPTLIKKLAPAFNEVTRRIAAASSLDDIAPYIPVISKLCKSEDFGEQAVSILRRYIDAAIRQPKRSLTVNSAVTAAYNSLTWLKRNFQNINYSYPVGRGIVAVFKRSVDHDMQVLGSLQGATEADQIRAAITLQDSATLPDDRLLSRYAHGYHPEDTEAWCLSAQLRCTDPDGIPDDQAVEIIDTLTRILDQPMPNELRHLVQETMVETLGNVYLYESSGLLTMPKSLRDDYMTIVYTDYKSLPAKDQKDMATLRHQVINRMEALADTNLYPAEMRISQK